MAGLSTEEAAAKLAQCGPNALPGVSSPSLLRIFIRQFLSPLIYILLAAAVVSLALGEVNDAIFIAIVLLINGLIGTAQEYSADRAAASLRKLEQQMASVVRDGNQREIDARELVPGDLVLLEAGGRVPADIQILESTDLQCDESLLTGESAPVKKAALSLAKDSSSNGRDCVTFAGSMIARGAWFNLVVSAFVFAGLSYSTGDLPARRRLILFFLFVITLVSIIVLWALSTADISQMFWERFSLTQSYDVSEGGRFNNMYDALMAALGNPLGLGPYQWALLAGLMPHNTYVNVFVSGGLIALLGFVALFVMTLSIGFRALKRQTPMKDVHIAALAAFIGLMVQCLLIDINHWRHLYILAALIWGLGLAADTRRGMKVTI